MSKALKLDRHDPYSVIVCGAGHAGCEAALAAARMGESVLLLTGNLDTIAQMSCNPAIGGLAKGNIVREIDALGGEMAVNTDLTAIQFRMLNTSKGPAVQAPRAQCDKKAYQFRMKHVLERQDNLTIFQALVDGLIYEQGKVVGVRTTLGVDFFGKTVIVTTGTFLAASLHVGRSRSEGGRMGDHTVKGLSKSFLEAGIELERLKTGTPPRILGNTVDLSGLEEQKADEQHQCFAFWDTRAMFHVEQLLENSIGWAPGSVRHSCWLTYTSPETESIIRDNLHQSALYGGEITGTGPRYCPSIEDKYVKFPDKPRHLLFLEPEGRHSEEWYINGFSTSLPLDIQIKALHSIPGLENAVLLRPAYAVEYDFAPPTQIFASLESKKVENLFFAGQINGTSGYEEAAGQGLVAGINAVRKGRGEEPIVLRRDQAYIGVLIDDLVTKGTSEPYRMFTSRAEYRLLLNHGSADLRLLDVAKEAGVLPENRISATMVKQAAVHHWVEQLEYEPAKGGSVANALRRGEQEVAMPQAFLGLSHETQAEVRYRLRYKSYIERELKHLDKARSLGVIKVPAEMDYTQVKGLRNEARQKLADIRPSDLGQAARISGVNPADISVLMVHLDVSRRKRTSAPC